MDKEGHKHRKHKSLLKGSKTRKFGIVFVSLLPMIISGVWLVFLKTDIITQYTGVSLSPGRTSGLAIGLVFFIVGYLTFLIMMFSEDLRYFYERLFKHKVH